MNKHAGSFELILDAVAAEHDINAYINLLARDGNITLVGAPPKPLAVGAFGLLMRRRSLSGSLIGGLAETQEMLDFCGKNNIIADVEVIPISEGERSVRAAAEVRCEVPLLHRHGIAEGGVSRGVGVPPLRRRRRRPRSARRGTDRERAIRLSISAST